MKRSKPHPNRHKPVRTGNAVPTAPSAEDLSACLQGRTELLSGNPLGAIALFNAGIRDGHLSSASLARTYRNIGIAYRHAKQPDQAIEAFTQAIALLPDDVEDDYVNRGNAYDDAGRFEEALADYDIALKIKPGYANGLYNRGIMYEHRQMYDKACADFIAAYNHGLRTSLLVDRLVAYELLRTID